MKKGLIIDKFNLEISKLIKFTIPEKETITSPMQLLFTVNTFRDSSE